MQESVDNIMNLFAFLHLLFFAINLISFENLNVEDTTWSFCLFGYMISLWQAQVEDLGFMDPDWGGGTFNIFMKTFEDLMTYDTGSVFTENAKTITRQLQV